MQLTPSDQGKLLLAVAGMVARDRRERGVKLNQPEAVALLSCWVIERARDGIPVAQLMAAGRTVLAREDVMEGVPELVDVVQVEAMLPDGRTLVTLHDPIQCSQASSSPRRDRWSSTPGASGAWYACSTPATGRSRSARTSTSPRSTTRCRSIAARPRASGSTSRRERRCASSRARIAT